MNEGIRYADICDRLTCHDKQCLDEFEFSYVFPDVAYHDVHSDTPEAYFLGNWFAVSRQGVMQICTYQRGDNGRMLTSFEWILRITEE